MENIRDLINLRNSLPKGRIYKKTIKGKIYYYHQYSSNGVKHTDFVKPENLETMEKDIQQRILLDKQIKAILSPIKNNYSLSIHAKELTGYLMSEDIVVATFEKGELISLNEQLCPLMVKRTHRLEPFLKTRVIDGGRTNSRLLKKALNIQENEDELISLTSYGASISDNYWFKPKNSKLKYRDICFNNDLFFDVSLKGLVSFYPNKIVLTPEITTNGSFEKGWKYIDGNFWLYKVGTNEEIFSELFYATLFELLKLPTAHYEYDDGYIRSMNFSKDYNFEPMISIADSNESYEYIYSLLKNIDRKIARDYLRLCFFDVVLNNIDRHNENCGLLRDKITGDIISLAPNYDDNLSLISRDTTLVISEDEGFLKQFIKLIRSNKEIKEELRKANIPLLNERIIDECLNKINVKIPLDKNHIKDYIMFRYNSLIKHINK